MQSTIENVCLAVDKLRAFEAGLGNLPPTLDGNDVVQMVLCAHILRSQRMLTLQGKCNAAQTFSESVPSTSLIFAAGCAGCGNASHRHAF